MRLYDIYMIIYLNRFTVLIFSILIRLKSNLFWTKNCQIRNEIYIFSFGKRVLLLHFPFSVKYYFCDAKAICVSFKTRTFSSKTNESHIQFRMIWVIIYGSFVSNIFLYILFSACPCLSHNWSISISEIQPTFCSCSGIIMTILSTYCIEHIILVTRLTSILVRRLVVSLYIKIKLIVCIFLPNNSPRRIWHDIISSRMHKKHTQTP